MLSRILDIIQDSFPIAERPYAVLAEKLSALNVAEHAFGEDSSGPLKCAGGSDITEQSVFEAVESLRASGVIRRIGGVYDSRKLGYISRLCAGKVPTVATGAENDDALETFASAVNKIPAITHNYVRNHEYNVWFTVIAESEQEVSSIIDRLCAETSLHDVHAMAAKRMFKINTVMKSATSSADNGKHGVDSAAGLNLSKGCLASRALLPVPDSDKQRIRLLSGDIPHSLTPFTDLCVACGCELQKLLDGTLGDLAGKRMRRFGAILRHQEAGFAHNAMVCFRIDEREIANGGESLIAGVGKVLAANPHVSHCYERASFEGFPYNVYAMFHAESAEDLDCFITAAAQSIRAVPSIGSVSGSVPFAVLRSLRELKKTSFNFFE